MKEPVRIAFANQKGGVGKTTLTIQIAGAAASDKKSRILLVDTDPQGNMSKFFLNKEYQTIPLTINDLIVNDTPAKDIIQPTKWKLIDIIPCNLAFGDVDIKLAMADDAQFRLKEALVDVERDYDYVILDCAPNLLRATRMALTYASFFVVPVEAGEWAASGANQLTATVDAIKKRSNPDLVLLGIVINKLLGRRRYEADMVKVIRNLYGDTVFKSIVRNIPLFAEANSTHKLIANKSISQEDGVLTIKSLFKEMMERVEKFYEPA
jgi:chromosome partitioning protein